jgi:hypothetical protein
LHREGTNWGKRKKAGEREKIGGKVENAGMQKIEWGDWPKSIATINLM